MSTYTQIYYHIVFSTKNRVPCLAKARRDQLFKYIWGILKNKKCHLYHINGVDDHIHILTSLHQTVTLADLLRDIKISSSKLIKERHIFSSFTNWQSGYGAFTHSLKEKQALVDYIKNQEAHHTKETFQDEYKRLLLEAGIQFDEKFLF